MRPEHSDADGAEPELPGPPEADPPPLFRHQPWMVGVVMVFAATAIVAGLNDPVWWLIGSPFILALVLYLGVRFTSRR
jgi:hypothetical protein